MSYNSNIIWDISCVSAAFYRTNPSVQLGLLPTAEGQRAILNNVWYYIHPSTDVHGIGNHAPRRTPCYHIDSYEYIVYSLATICVSASNRFGKRKHKFMLEKKGGGGGEPTATQFKCAYYRHIFS